MGSCGSNCCCCCGKRGATVAFGLLGLLLAAAVIAGPVYVYNTDQDYSKLFPVIRYGRICLAQIAGGDPQKEADLTTSASVVVVSDDGSSAAQDESTTMDLSTPDLGGRQSSSQTYKLAIFQLLDDIEQLTPQLALFTFCMGCVNAPLNLLLLIGAASKKSCPLMPWIVLTLVEHLVVGIPLIVFFGLISLYLACQLHLYIWASVLMGLIIFTFFFSLTTWFTVYSCYNEFANGGYDVTAAYATSVDSQATQPLLNAGGPPPPLPPNHPAGSQNGGGYQLGQYPQYYPPHSGGQPRALPTAPPTSSNGIYPQLPNA